MKIYTKTRNIALHLMFNQRENALKRPSTYIILFYTKRLLFKKKLMRNLIKIYTKTHQIAHFFKIFSLESMPPTMCTADIIISI